MGSEADYQKWLNEKDGVDKAEIQAYSELKPCPFCGGKAEVTKLGIWCRNAGNVDGSCNAHLFYPASCIASGDVLITKQIEERSKKQWNKRPIEDALTAEIERLKELYSFQVTGDESSGMIQLEFQEGNRELEIEFSHDMKVGYLKTEGEQMQEGEVLHAHQLFELLQWLKAGE